MSVLNWFFHVTKLNEFTENSSSQDTPLPSYNRGAHMVGTWFTYEGDEELMKKMVYTHGAVVTSFYVKDNFFPYSGGIYAGCTPEEDSHNHAVAVVGYGSAVVDGQSVDYWLVKNSWADSWGEGGFFRIKRGVQMCGMGPRIAVVDCAPLADDNQPLPPPVPNPEEPTNDGSGIIQ
jgi:C1A family cysteine protease